MFEAVIRELASRFGLGDKALSLLQLVLAYVTNPDSGGIGGFIEKFGKAGLGSVAQSWLGGGIKSQDISAPQIESALGGAGGLLSLITGKLGVGGSVASSALTYLLPAVIGKLTPGGAIPASLPAEISSLMGNAKDLLAGGSTAAVAAQAPARAAAAATSGADSGGGGGGLMRWLPWIVGAAVAFFLLNQCTSKKGVDTAAVKQEAASAAGKAKDAAADAAKAAADAAKTAASEVKADAAAAVSAATAATAAASAATAAVAEAAPAGAGAISMMVGGVPGVKIYFDSGKADVHADFGDKAKAVMDYLKANANAKAIVSGFHDPTGNKAQNEELSKNRAKAVAAALKAAGIGDERVVLQKPAETAGGGNLAEARRVEVTIQP